MEISLGVCDCHNLGGGLLAFIGDLFYNRIKLHGPQPSLKPKILDSFRKADLTQESI